MIRVQPVVPGAADGPAIVLDEALSLWGGFDVSTGAIVDAHHPQFGICLSGSVVFMPSGRGSSSSSSTLVEAVRIGTAPAALVLCESDDIVVLGALVAHELYDRTVPVALWSGDPSIVHGRHVRLEGSRLSIADA